MASSAMLKLFCLGLLGLLILAPHAEATITCGTVTGSLFPCLGYLEGQPQLDPGCCVGIRGLLARLQTKADRQTLCRCLKPLAQRYRSSIGKAKEIPNKCGVNLPYKLDPNINCSTVN